MNLKKFLIPAAMALAFVSSSAASDAATVHHRTVHRTVTHRGKRTVVRTTVNNRTVVRRPARVRITRDRAVVFFRGHPGIRYVGAPYIYGNYYVQRCYDPATGALAYCEIDPYTGAWLGIHVTL